MNIFYTLLILILWALFLQLLNIKRFHILLAVRDKLSPNKYQDLVLFLMEGQFNKLVPKYKFFSSIVEKLITYRRSYGADIRPALREIRGAARKDYSANKRLNEELLGFIVQYSIIAAFTWIFILNVSGTLDIKFSGQSLILLGVWQLFGLIVGIIIYHFSIRYFFDPFSNYFFTAYTFRSLITISRPISEISKLANISMLNNNKDLRVIKTRLLGLVQNIKVVGVVPLDEFDQIILELWDSYEVKLGKFKSMLAGLKLLLILLFVFTGFLYVIFLSMDKLAI
ncbi:MAG: hypothetical protein ACJAS4_002923 [Bacteriovoracaceae bacterium]|jgi:hypothetical protein